MMNKKISKTIATALTMNPLLECFIVFSTKTLSFKPKEIEKLLPRWRMKLVVTGEFFLTFFLFSFVDALDLIIHARHLPTDQRNGDYPCPIEFVEEIVEFEIIQFLATNIHH